MSGIVGGAGEKSGLIGYWQSTPWLSLNTWLVNGWVEQSSNYSVEYKVWGDQVFMHGIVKNGNAVRILQGLPERIRPTRLVLYPPSRDGSYSAGLNTHQALYIDNSGNISHYDWKSDWTSISCVYAVQKTNN